jgi:hypothetical protein
VVTSAALTTGSAGAGTVTLAGNVVSFTQATGFAIPDGSSSRAVTITYTVADGTGPGALSDTGTITVTVNNRLPTAGPDSASLDLFVSNQTAPINVLANDSDAETPTSGLVVSIISSSAGTATVSGGQVTYSHGASTVTGPVVVTYQVRDANNGTATGTLTINVTDSTPPPTTTTTTTTPPAGP